MRSTLPVDVFGHNGLVGVKIRVSGAGWVTVMLVLPTQPPASVTVTLYVPTPTLDKSCVTAWLFHAYVYGAAPPVTVRSMVAVVVPVQLTLAMTALSVSAALG